MTIYFNEVTFNQEVRNWWVMASLFKIDTKNFFIGLLLFLVLGLRPFIFHLLFPPLRVEAHKPLVCFTQDRIEWLWWFDGHIKGWYKCFYYLLHAIFRVTVLLQLAVVKEVWGGCEPFSDTFEVRLIFEEFQRETCILRRRILPWTKTKSFYWLWFMS